MITANNIVPQEQSNPYEMSSDLFRSSADIYKGMSEGAGTLTNVNEYINPYYEQVLDRVLGRMDRNFGMQLNQIGDQATAAGAFGGSRHGVAEGIARGEYNMNVGDVTANLMSQGFESAADRAYRDQMSSAQGQAGLGSTYFNVGNALTDRQMQQGAMQQSLLQTILGLGQQEFQQFQQYPMQLIDMYNAILAGDPRRGVAIGESSSTPGLFDYLALAAQAVSGTNFRGA